MPRDMALLVRLWREAHGFSQATAARKWGVTIRSWQRYESGERPVPPPLRRLITGRLRRLAATHPIH